MKMHQQKSLQLMGYSRSQKNEEKNHYAVSGYLENDKDKSMPFDLLSTPAKVIFEILKGVV